MRKMMMKGEAILLASLVCAAALTGCKGSADHGEIPAQGEQEEVQEALAEAEEDDNDKDSDASDQPEDVTVSADYLDDVKDRYPDYVDASESMNVKRSEYETVVLFHADGDAEDFRVFSMDLAIDENGNADYNPTEVFRAARLNKDTPVAVPLNFPGDMSVNGFCYKGPDGNLKTFIISISGKDGSLVISAENYAVPEQ